jgi:hypothetical protein
MGFNSYCGHSPVFRMLRARILAPRPRNPLNLNKMLALSFFGETVAALEQA